MTLREEDQFLPPARETPGEIVITRTPGRVQVVKAPALARISLRTLSVACEHEVRVEADRITLADQVTYRVTGWEPDPGNLLVRLVEDRRDR